MNEQNKKNVLITGASSGIGKDVGRRLAELGHTIISLDLNEKSDFENHFQCDVSSNESVENAFSKIKEKFSSIDVVINNAGFGVNGALEFSNMQTIEKVFQVNTLGAIRITNQSLSMMKSGGRIVNISSMAAFGPTPFRVVYGATKAALNSITYGYAMELEKGGIQACSVCPGEVATGFQANRIKNRETSQRYGESVEGDLKRLERGDCKRMNVSCVTDVVLKQLSKKKMKMMVIVGRKYKIVHFLKKITPTALFHKATNSIFNKKKG